MYACIVFSAGWTNADLHAAIFRCVSPWLRDPIEAAAKLPYTVYILNLSGVECGVCSWYSRCSGCVLNNDATPCVLKPTHTSFKLAWSDPSAIDPEKCPAVFRDPSAPVASSSSSWRYYQYNAVNADIVVRVFRVFRTA
jgi:hypothetical protein